MKPVTGNITGYRLTGNRLTTLLMFVVNRKDQGNCRIHLSVVVIFYRQTKVKSKKNDDDDDAVSKLCSQSSQSADC